MTLVGLVAGIAAIALIAIAVWWARPPDPASALRNERFELARVVREPLPELGARVERWRLVTTRGDTLFALWRAAPPESAVTWTAVLLGGLGTGDRAAALLPDHLPVHALAVDWPWRGPRQMPWAEFTRRVPEIRAAILRSPAVLALGVDAVRSEAHDRTRIVLLGASLGVPPAIAATRLTREPEAVVLLDGAADLEALLRHDLENLSRRDWQARPLAATAARLLHPLEPAHHFEAMRAFPVLLINASADERLPRHCVDALHRGLPHATSRWRDDTHVGPDRLDVIASVAWEARAWLDSLPPR